MKNPLSAGKLARAVTKKALDEGIAPARAMRWVAATALFELCRIAVLEGRIDGYCVKGGFSVELRLPQYARTSQDIDLIIHGAADPIELLQAVIDQRWDNFDFRIKTVDQRDHAISVVLQTRFNNTNWNTLKVDLLTEPMYVAEEIDAPDVQAFGLTGTSGVPCLSLSQQLAQWIHSVTKPANYEGKRPDRARNIVDFFLFTTYFEIDEAAALREVLVVFERERTHTWPTSLDLPATWTATLQRYITELELSMTPDTLVAHFVEYLDLLATA